MSEEEVISLRLKYGLDGLFQADLLSRQLLLHHACPDAARNEVVSIEEALSNPLDFPDPRQTFVPDDRAVVIIDLDTPRADAVFAALWDRMSSAGLKPENVTLIQPAIWKKVDGIDPRGALPKEIREEFPLLRHDPTVEGSCAYLASTASGERVYLSRVITDADVVITIGPGEFDPILGVRGTSSSLFPGLSDLHSLQRAQGQGHEELGPDEPRPFRQLVDEIGWLLGLQFSIAVIPAGGRDAHEFIAGQTDSVQRRIGASLRENWLVRTEERAELVLVTVPWDAAGHGWDQVAAAINAARRLVERHGRIVVLSQLDVPPGPGLEVLKSVREPRDAIKEIQKTHPPDFVAATRIAAATDWANVSILSRLNAETISDLFMLPLENEREVARLLETEDLTAVIEAAQHVFVQSGV